MARLTSILKLTVSILAGGLSFGAASLSQDAVRLQKPLQHEVAVTLKLIQVYVTDKSGKPIVDLTKDDFMLYDEGKPQKLTEFEKHVLSRPAPAARAEEHVIQTPVPPSPRLLNRKFFLFFDFAYNNPPGVPAEIRRSGHRTDNRHPRQPPSRPGRAASGKIK